MDRFYDFRKFVLENKFYLWLILLSLILNVFFYLHSEYFNFPQKEEFSPLENISPENIVKNIEKNMGISQLLSITFYLLFFLFIIGIYFCLSFFVALSKGKIFIFSYDFPKVNWQVLDIFRVIVIILFFANLLRLSELIFLRSLEMDFFAHFIIRAFIFDFFSLGTVLYFVSKKYFSSLSHLGLKLDNFINNLLLSLFHYIGVLPLLFLTIFLSIFFTEFFKYKPEPSPLLFFFFYPQPKLLIFLVTIFIVFIGPVIEEIFFRGFCYPALRNRLGPLKAMFLVSFFFALLHMNIIGFLPIFILGLLLVYIYEKTHSLVSSIGIHMLHNLFILYLVFLYRALLLK